MDIDPGGAQELGETGRRGAMVHLRLLLLAFRQRTYSEIVMIFSSCQAFSLDNCFFFVIIRGNYDKNTLIIIFYALYCSYTNRKPI